MLFSTNVNHQISVLSGPLGSRRLIWPNPGKVSQQFGKMWG